MPAPACRFSVPDLGVGAGLRVPHYRYVLDHSPAVGFFEVISENFLGRGGKPLQHLDEFKERYPMVLHGVSLGIGGPEEPDREFLLRLRDLVRRVKPPWISDHFCWSSAGGAHVHDLLPLPYTEAALRRVVRRAKMIQDMLEVPFALENTSSYLSYQSSTMTEWEFVGRALEEADIGLLFDVNNVYVSAYNHGFDPLEFVRRVPHERILQIHLAGHTNYGTHIIDTHVGPPISPVLELYRETIRRAGPVSTLLEWDDQLPEFPELLGALAHIALVRSEGLSPDCPPLDGISLSRPASEPTSDTPSGASAGAGAVGLSGWSSAHEVDEPASESEVS